MTCQLLVQCPHNYTIMPHLLLIKECCANDRLLASDAVDEETGDLRSKEDHEHRQLSEREKLRVIWNTERRCFFDSNGVKK